MQQTRFKIGDMIQLVPENFFGDWYQGTGLIVDIENGDYVVMMFDLKKTSRKRLVEIELGHQTTRFKVVEADQYGYFKSAD